MRIAFDRGDERLARRPLDESGEASVRDDGNLSPGESLQVHAGAEGAAGSGNDAQAEVVPAVQGLEGRGEFLGELQRHGVLRLRAVQRQDEYPAAFLDEQGLFFAAHACSPTPVMARPERVL
jgi:hypothetical protein